MPAQWPIFINKLSSKLAAKNSSGPNGIANFVANEYFNAVKTAQTPFGNIHNPGEKSILEDAFKKAFNILYDSIEPELDQKFGNSIYEDMFENFPKINLNYDPLCEMEKWTLKNRDNIEPFQYYQFFQSTCPIETEDAEVFGTISVTQEIIDSEKFDVIPTEVIMQVIGGDGVAPYSIEYRLNDIRLSATTDSQGISRVELPTLPGNYTYIFDSAIDSTRLVELKNINQSASITINEDGIPSNVVVIPNATRKIVSELAEDARADEVAKRVLMQNDRSVYFRRWIENIDINNNSSFVKKVKLKVLKLMDDGVLIENTLNDRIFQENHKVHPTLIPDWLTADFITTFTYNNQFNKYLSMDDYKKNLKYKDPFGIRYTSKYLKDKDKEAMSKKNEEYLIEEDRFNKLKMEWVQSNSNIEEATSLINEDAYTIMADGIINYWKSTTTSPFKSTPPILPCNLPSPGIFTPISYGDRQNLASDLRKAWNTGKQFKTQQTLKVATIAVATAVAVSCAKHLKNLKFVYVGKLSIGPTTIPMVSISPFAF